MPGNPIKYEFEPALVILPEEQRSISLCADIKEDTNYSNFQLFLESPQNDIEAVNEENVPVQIGDSFCLPVITISSELVKLVDPDFEVNFYNFPNPFGTAQMSSTNFNYYLEQDTDLTIRIYTLMGELVWSCAYKDSEPEGRAGLHNGSENPTILWHGKNDLGQKVLNGVYIAVITANENRAITKVAVAR
jgi:hypothetical protein